MASTWKLHDVCVGRRLRAECIRCAQRIGLCEQVVHPLCGHQLCARTRAVHCPCSESCCCCRRDSIGPGKNNWLHAGLLLVLRAHACPCTVRVSVGSSVQTVEKVLHCCAPNICVCTSIVVAKSHEYPRFLTHLGLAGFCSMSTPRTNKHARGSTIVAFIHAYRVFRFKHVCVRACVHMCCSAACMHARELRQESPASSSMQQPRLLHQQCIISLVFFLASVLQPKLLPHQGIMHATMR